MKKAKCNTIRVVDLNDDWLQTRLAAACASARVKLTVLDDPQTLTPQTEIDDFASGKGKLFFTNFYMRKRLQILLEPDGKPIGGKWSFDAENRKKLPATVRPPRPAWPTENEFVREARTYVRANFPDAPGSDASFAYPTSAAEARAAGCVSLDDISVLSRWTTPLCSTRHHTIPPNWTSPKRPRKPPRAWSD